MNEGDGGVVMVKTFLFMVFMAGFLTAMGFEWLRDNPLLAQNFLLYITYMNLGGNKWNIFGVLWLLALMAFYCKRFYGHFNLNNFFPKPEKNPRSLYWRGALILFSFTAVFLVQMVVDDFITTPINLAFGSWDLLAPHLGEFSFYKLFMFKVDVYLLILLYATIFAVLRIWQFYHFTRYSALWLSLTILLQILLGSQHIFYFLNLEGSERLITFWISYPWFRIFTGLFAASIIKEPESGAREGMN